jgi:hypothetical protein
LVAAYLRIAPDAARRALYGRDQWRAGAGEAKSIRRAPTATPTIYYVPRVVVATPAAVAVQRRDAVGDGAGRCEGTGDEARGGIGNGGAASTVLSRAKGGGSNCSAAAGSGQTRRSEAKGMG